MACTGVSPTGRIASSRCRGPRNWPRCRAWSRWNSRVRGQTDLGACAKLPRADAVSRLLLHRRAGASILATDGRAPPCARSAVASGFVVPGDAKALIVTRDLNAGWLARSAVSRDDQPCHSTFTQHGLAGRRTPCGSSPASARPAGPSGVGAKLTLTLADGSITRTAEVAAGLAITAVLLAAFFSYPAATPGRASSSSPGRTARRRAFRELLRVASHDAPHRTALKSCRPIEAARHPEKAAKDPA